MYTVWQVPVDSDLSGISCFRAGPRPWERAMRSNAPARARRAATTLARLAGLAVRATLLLLAASANSTPVGSLRVADAWIRWLPAGLPAAGYFTLINDGDTPVALVAAESPDFASVTLHRSIERAGVVRMEPVQEVPVGPRSHLDLAAKGYHLMLMAPVRPIDTQRQVSITLRFGDGRTLPVLFQVRTTGSGS